MISVPPALTKLLLAVPPDSTTNTPPLLTVVLVSAPPLAISSVPPLSDGPLGAARAGHRPFAADHVEGGETQVLRSDRAEVERIGPAPAKLEVVVAGGIDDAADGVAGAEGQRVAAAGELDRRAARAD